MQVSEGLNRGGELGPECEFAAVKLHVKTREYDRMKERQTSKMTMKEILVPLIGIEEVTKGTSK